MIWICSCNNVINPYVKCRLCGKPQEKQVRVRIRKIVKAKPNVVEPDRFLKQFVLAELREENQK